MAVSKRLRYEVLQRDNFTCRYCHRTDVPLTIDHVVPVALGGADVPENLVAACKECNAGKSSTNPDRPLVENVTSDALRWAAAMKRAGEIQRENREMVAAYCDQFYEAWGTYYTLAWDWRDTLARWFELGLEMDFLTECIDIAQGARGVDWYWKYFCGVVYKSLRQRADIARDLLANEGEDAQP